MTKPYRVLARVEPLPPIPTDPLRLAGALPFTELRGRSYERCPFCNTPRDTYYQSLSVSNGPKVGDSICDGTRRWWRPWGCALFVSHFHVRCVTCQKRWIMAPANVQL